MFAIQHNCIWLLQGHDERPQAGDTSEGAMYSEAELTEEFSFGHSLKESPVDLGSAFLAKLQKKGKTLECFK